MRQGSVEEENLVGEMEHDADGPCVSVDCRVINFRKRLQEDIRHVKKSHNPVSMSNLYSSGGYFTTYVHRLRKSKYDNSPISLKYLQDPSHRYVLTLRSNLPHPPQSAQ